MLRHQRIESESIAETAYLPVARRDVMTEAHIEDFLDHQAAPLVGRISYEERQELRAELRQQILSLAAAHQELGSTRGEAIALALNSMAAKPVEMAAQRATPELATRAATGAFAGSLKLALWSFGIAGLASLLVVAASENASGAAVPFLLSSILGAFPFAAGSVLGLKKAQKQFSAMVAAQWMLYLPVTLGFILVTHGPGGDVPLFRAAAFTLIYTISTTLFGSLGIHAGNWIGDACSRFRRKR